MRDLIGLVDARAAAERTRGSIDGAMFHSDHGARYTSKAFAAPSARSATLVPRSFATYRESGEARNARWTWNRWVSLRTCVRRSKWPAAGTPSADADSAGPIPVPLPDGPDSALPWTCPRQNLAGHEEQGTGTRVPATAPSRGRDSGTTTSWGGRWLSRGPVS